MNTEEPRGCLHPMRPGEECDICAEREDAAILAMSSNELLAECTREGLNADRIPAEMEAATRRAILSMLSTRALFNELVRRLNYDGSDIASLTLGEIDRAIPLPRRPA